MAAPEHKWHKWPARLCLDSSIVRASHNFFLLLIELLELHIISILRINKTFPAISGKPKNKKIKDDQETRMLNAARGSSKAINGLNSKTK